MEGTATKFDIIGDIRGRFHTLERFLKSPGYLRDGDA
jgi:hypothetical protein